MVYCSLVFDDGYQETFTNALPVLKENNIKATFAVALEPEHIEKSENIKCARPKTWALALKAGHELASHTITHRALTNLKPDELELELRTPAKQLNAKTLIYPGGGHNYEVEKIARKYYDCARTVEIGANIPPIKNWFNLKTFVLTRNSNPWQKIKKGRQLKQTMQETIKNEGWLILSYHLISDTNKKYKFTTTNKELREHINILSEAGLEINTIKSIYQKLKNTGYSKV